MFDCVPDPVCQTTNGNSLSRLPSRISSQTFAIKVDFSAGRTPKSVLANAAAFFKYANAWIISFGILLVS